MKSGANQVQILFDKANALRVQQRWTQAAAIYETLSAGLLKGSSSWASVQQNWALCLYGIGDLQMAASRAVAAWTALPALWQAGLLALNALKAINQTDAYAELLERVHAMHADKPRIAMAYATLVMNHLGDAKRARDLAQPWLNHPDVAQDAWATILMTRLYDRDPDDTPEKISDDIRTFAKRFLVLDNTAIASAADDAAAITQATGRLRVGVVSNLFSVSPVHAFGFTCLQSLHAAGHELTFINRGRQDDWATDQFKSLASQWLNVASMDAAGLHTLLRSLNLDVLYDMAGWMDVEVLKALSVKPARRMYKWVGGQSCTTGLESFDGFISDAQQSPVDTAHLYSEPLVICQRSYVDYLPPGYVKDIATERGEGQIAVGAGDWGVIANPLKLSRSFLQWLNQLGSQQGRNLPVAGSDRRACVERLLLVDKRYARPEVRQRVEAALQGVWGERLVFVTPKGHEAFMREVAALEGLIDTFPYSCGLTMAEGLTLNVDIAFPDVERKLFCERHGIAHWTNSRLNGLSRSVPLNSRTGLPA